MYSRSIFKKAFSKYLVATNVITSGLLMGIGDAAEQEIEIRREIHPTGTFDWVRIRDMTIVGFVIGGPQHYLYEYMDKFLPGTSGRTIVKKIALDQSIVSPVCIFLFFVGLGVAEQGSVAKGFEEFKKKFITVYSIDWCFWPPTQYINFAYVPSKFRVMYVNVMTCFYDVFLSYAKFII
ncbi:hypothetical protein LSTR_LSTR006813 [Laodelphax striatellus]|uniref:Mpv17-like protein 2 n=1 Tax=Laodelphax striatellus TaxID=195883 RepID=A0A482XET0_LAOST|nr:hypothetical protein LSTR_LSTR006813 [Laodelphax striatellus]